MLQLCSLSTAVQHCDTCFSEHKRIRTDKVTHASHYFTHASSCAGVGIGKQSSMKHLKQRNIKDHRYTDN